MRNFDLYRFAGGDERVETKFEIGSNVDINLFVAARNKQSQRQ
jgi:hypothetical protein